MKNVIYRKYAGYLYLVNLGTGKGHVFEGIAGDLMDFLTEAESVDEVFARVEAEYEVDDPAQMRTEVSAFVEFLRTEGFWNGGNDHDGEKNCETGGEESLQTPRAGQLG